MSEPTVLTRYSDGRRFELVMQARSPDGPCELRAVERPRETLRVRNDMIDAEYDDPRREPNTPRCGRCHRRKVFMGGTGLKWQCLHQGCVGVRPPKPVPRDCPSCGLPLLRQSTVASDGADFDPRLEPPTPDEVRALGELNPSWGATVVRFRCGTLNMMDVTQSSGSAWPADATWIGLSPNGIVRWSTLAKAVARLRGEG